MVDFGKPLYGNGHSANDYFPSPANAMDKRSYLAGGGGERGATGGSYEFSDLGVDKIGMSVPMGIAANNIQGIYSKIRMGAGSLEIQFPGHGSGRPGAHAPENYGTDQRTAIKEMGMANEVNFTTHASFQMFGMTGYDGRGFDIKNAQKNLEELKTAIDFQADIGKGGSVVMHAGEFDRPLTDMYLDDQSGHLNLSRDKSGRLLFRQYNTQERAGVFTVLDDRTHQRQDVQRDRLVSYPDWLVAEKDYYGYADDDKEKRNRILIRKGEYINYFGQKLSDPFGYEHPENGRVPVLREQDGTAQVRLRSFDDFREEANRFNTWFEEKYGRKPNYYEKLYPEEAFARAGIESQIAQFRGLSLYYSRTQNPLTGTVSSPVELRRSLNEAQERFDQGYDFTGNPLTEESRREMKQRLDQAKASLLYARSSTTGYENQLKEAEESKRHIIAPIKRLEKEGVRLYAEAAIHAMRRSEDPNNPITVAIEHIFPEQFGGHPEELKWIIKKSRERMVDLLTRKTIEHGSSEHPVKWDEGKYERDSKTGESKFSQPNPHYLGISKEEAEKIAEKHLKATIDTGHINMWRKYYQDDPKKTPEQNDKSFKEWVVKSIESLAKDGMVGNVHLADNYGYHDDHLSPGQGNSPIKDIMRVVRKHGYDRAITVEPGADAMTDLGDFHGLMKTWRFFGSSVYGMGGFRSGGSGGNWNDIQHSYFGQGRPPYYVFGSYAPSNDWSLWSQVPLE